MNLAIFDLDNTLLNGDSDYNWSLFLIKKGILDQSIYEQQNEEFFKDYQTGSLDIDAYAEFQFKPLRENERFFLNDLRDEYVATIIRPMITEKAKDLVNEHRSQGDQLLIITATNSFITKPIAALFGIEELIGTDLEEINNQFTGKIKGVASFQEGKVTRLNQWLDEKHLTLAQFDKTFFYSDSKNDLPLLRIVSHPVAVNPDATLNTEAKKNNWPIMSLR
ncbi:MAG: HAD-IB family hydrolase [Proteobacteria bacterium]|nr:HAD-IB family hydrolase [Pseudomonadota bacterium]MDA0873410.1 HAD-IB family hydrolase [Pseudomonadota bacterium]MDA1133636.1 HAD-IB family hydrolase [Pseudomonadota bacterium]